MRVKWRGQLSSIRYLPGSGPQGSTFGVLEYLSQSNDNADNVPPEDRFKFMDDLTILEIIHLASVGLASCNIRAQVPSNIPVQYSSNLQRGQTYFRNQSSGASNQKKRHLTK